HLASTTLNEINARLTAAGRRLADARDAEDVAALVSARAALRRELADYQAIDEQHGALHLALLNLAGVLARIEEALQGDATMDDAAGELVRLEAELRAPAQGGAPAVLAAAS